MKILINDYAGHPFSLDLAIQLSKKNKIIYTYFKNDIGAFG